MFSFNDRMVVGVIFLMLLTWFTIMRMIHILPEVRPLELVPSANVKHSISIIFFIPAKASNVESILDSASKVQKLPYSTHFIVNSYTGVPFKTKAPDYITFTAVKSRAKTKFWSVEAKPSLILDFDYVLFIDEDMVFDPTIFSLHVFVQTAMALQAAIARPPLLLDNGKKGSTTGQMNFGEYGVQSMAYDIDFAESGVVLFKSEAWGYYYDEIFLHEYVESDWGADIIWCKAIAKRFKSSHPCVLVMHTPIVHLDSKSSTKKGGSADIKTLNMYKSTYPDCVETQKKIPISMEAITRGSQLLESSLYKK